MIETEVLEPTAVVEETVQTAEVPEAPEVLAATGDEPELTAASATPDRPRDAQGRFLKKDGSPVAPDEQAALTAAAASPATPTTAPPAPVRPAGDPFVFRADGQKIPIPGSTLTADGALSIPADQVPVIRQLLAEGMAHRGSWRQKEADYQRQIQESGSVEKARADKYNAAAVMLFDKINDDEWLMALAADPQRERGYLSKELGFALRDADLNAPRAQAPQQQAAPDDAQLEQAFSSALSEEVDDLLDDPSVKALFSPEDRTEIKAAFADRMQAYAAMHEGELKLDLHKLKKDFGREVQLQRKAKQAQVDAQKAADFNAKRNPTAAVIPPTVSTKGPGGSGSATKTFKNREEWRKSMGMN